MQTYNWPTVMALIGFPIHAEFVSNSFLPFKSDI